MLGLFPLLIQSIAFTLPVHLLNTQIRLQDKDPATQILLCLSEKAYSIRRKILPAELNQNTHLVEFSSLVCLHLFKSKVNLQLLTLIPSYSTSRFPWIEKLNKDKPNIFLRFSNVQGICRDMDSGLVTSFASYYNSINFFMLS